MANIVSIALLMDIDKFEFRKRDHIRHALDPAHQAFGFAGFERVHLNHEALPELDFDEVVLASRCFEKQTPTPFYIAGMTAGHPEAASINLTLARACQEKGWAMGVGSQRRELENGTEDIDQWCKLREAAPDLLLFSNIGLAQALSVSVDVIRRLVDIIGAQGIAIHLNALQEVFQRDGTPRFRGGAAKLREICKKIGVPVILKETGCGFSATTLGRLADVGLAAVDVSGLGGTHWGRIEGARVIESVSRGSIVADAAETFACWGESTVDSLLCAKKNLSGVEIWASGGVRSGLDAAKAIVLGAQRVGYAQPALEAALKGSIALTQWMERQEFELKTALFCTGCGSLEELREKEGVWKLCGR